MSKTYKLNRRWQFALFGLSILLIVFISIFIPVYLSEQSWIFLALILAMLILSGLLVFGAFFTKIVISPSDLTGVAFGRSTVIPWENIDHIDINPVNLLIFAKLRNPRNEVFAISPFITNDLSDNLLLELTNYLPKEKFQKELYGIIREDSTEK